MDHLVPFVAIQLNHRKYMNEKHSWSQVTFCFEHYDFHITKHYSFDFYLYHLNM